MQREITRVRMAQTLRGDLTSDQEAHLIDLLAEKVGGDSYTDVKKVHRKERAMLRTLRSGGSVRLSVAALHGAPNLK